MAQAVPPEKMTARKAQAVERPGSDGASRYPRDKGSAQAVTTTAQRAGGWEGGMLRTKEEIGSLPDPISMRPSAAASG